MCNTIGRNLISTMKYLNSCHVATLIPNMEIWSQLARNAYSTHTHGCSPKKQVGEVERLCEWHLFNTVACSAFFVKKIAGTKKYLPVLTLVK